MYLRKMSMMLSVSFLVLFTSTFMVWADIWYQARGNEDTGYYSEGISPKPVTEPYIELLSVLVAHKREAEQTPDWLRLKFYLPEPALLFHVALEFLDDLSSTTISNSLRSEFDSNLESPLSHNTTVSVEDEDSRWLVYDQYNKQRYIVRKAESQLNVYSSLVYITVQDIDPAKEHYYRLDKILPPEPWKPEAYNSFKWPTSEVIQQLEIPLRMKHLGVLARFVKSKPTRPELVAPVVLYHSKPPEDVKAYEFTYRVDGDLKATCSVYRKGVDKPVYEKSYPFVPGGDPFLFRWDSSKETEGVYILKISGYWHDDGAAVDESVEFYHRPTIK